LKPCLVIVKLTTHALSLKVVWLAVVTTEWMILENGNRVLSVCQDGIPIFYPNDWLLQINQNATSPKTAKTYAQRLAIFFKWIDISGIPLERFNQRHWYEFQSCTGFAVRPHELSI
jgi:hypothetical protein